MWISGCGFTTAFSLILSINSWVLATRPLFQKMSPAALTAMTMFSGLVWVAILAASGRCTGMILLITGTVIRKMISSTSITSTNGVVLMVELRPESSPSSCTFIDISVTCRERPGPAPRRVCDYGASVRLLADRSGGGGRRSGRAGSIGATTDAGATYQIGMHVGRKVPQILLQTLVAADQPVVAEHRRHGDDQTEGRHDQRLTDGAGDAVNAGLAGDTDGDQRLDDADDGTEQTDEGGSGTDAGEPAQAGLQGAIHVGNRTLQGHGDPLVQIDPVGQTAVVMGRGAQTFFDDRAIGITLLEALDAILQRRGSPEGLLHRLVGAGQLTLVP